jgi:hypothetical protein
VKSIELTPAKERHRGNGLLADDRLKRVIDADPTFVPAQAPWSTVAALHFETWDSGKKQYSLFSMHPSDGFPSTMKRREASR